MPSRQQWLLCGLECCVQSKHPCVPAPCVPTSPAVRYSTAPYAAPDALWCAQKEFTLTPTCTHAQSCSHAHSSAHDTRARAQANSEVSALLGRIPSAVGYQPTLSTDMGGLQERITTTDKGSITSVQVCARVGRQACMECGGEGGLAALSFLGCAHAAVLNKACTEAAWMLSESMGPCAQAQVCANLRPVLSHPAPPNPSPKHPLLTPCGVCPPVTCCPHCPI